jgi:hypothetical protein
MMLVETPIVEKMSPVARQSDSTITRIDADVPASAPFTTRTL